VSLKDQHKEIRIKDTGISRTKENNLGTH